MNTLDKIIQLLEEQNHQQKDLTDFLGLEKSTFSAWKNGKSSSYKKYLPEIASFFKISVDELVGTEKKDETENLPEELVILNRNAKKMSPENRKKLLDMARIMFKEDFDE